MKTAAITITSSLLTGIAAYDFSQWNPAGPGDVRSPCPVLNALANHDILPHSGKGLTVPMLNEVLDKALNISPDLTTILAVGGVLTSPNPLGLSFDLDNLNKHNDIEHDASLGHNDFALGDNHLFNQTLFNTYLTYYDGMNKTNLEQASKGRMMRVMTESRRDPDFTYGPKQLIISYGETSLVLSALGDPVNCEVPVDWLKIVFEQERLPWKEGWRTTNQTIDAVTVNAMLPRMMALSGEALPEGLLLTTNTIMKAFAGLDPLSDTLSALQRTLFGIFGLSL